MSGKLIQLVWLLWLLPFQVLAEDAVIVQNRIPVDKPLVLNGDVFAKIDRLKTAFDSQNGRFFVMDSTVIYAFDIRSRTWETYATISTEFLKFKIDYSVYHDGLLFWDQGVGRVFKIDSTKTMIRLDKSFNHQNQFGHASWLDPNTGTIFAFGGYGLFKVKSLLTRYNPLKQEWNETYMMDPHQWPAPQILPSVFPDLTNEKIYFLGLKMSHADFYTRDFPPDEKQLKAFWEYDLQTNTWTRLADFPMYLDGKTARYKELNLTNYSVNPHLDFLLFSREGDISKISSSGLHLFDIQDKSVKKITDIEPNFSDLEYYLNIQWSEVDSVFYVLTVEFNFNLRRVVIHPHKIEIKDEATFLSRLRDQNEPDSTIISVLIALVLISVPFGAWVTYKYRTSRNKKEVQIESEHPKVVIKLDRMDNMTLSYERREMDRLPEGEWLLLKILSKCSLEKNVYITSDEIEAALLPSHPSQDYLRRFRNLTMDRLISYLATFTGDKNREFIVKRPTLLDKRKFEYRLNDSYFKVEVVEKVENQL